MKIFYNNKRLWCIPNLHVQARQYGEWENGRCKGLSSSDKADYEDPVCDEPQDAAQYRKTCG